MGYENPVQMVLCMGCGKRTIWQPGWARLCFGCMVARGMNRGR